MKKKLLALFLVLAVMMSSALLAVAADAATTTSAQTSDSAQADTVQEEKSPFYDLATDHTNYEAIKYLSDQKVINGYEDGSFHADNIVTRAEFTKMLMEIAGYANIYGDGVVNTGFPDVDAGEAGEPHWAAKYIRVAVEQKIINGYEDGTFRPEHPVKYEEAIKMVVCYLGREVEARDIVTIDKIPLWPDAYLKVGAKHSLSKNAVSSVGVNISRAIVAQIIYNTKDVDKIVTIPNSGYVSVGGVGGVGGGFGGGGSNKNDSQTVQKKWEALEKGQSVSGLSVSGTVVGTVEVLKNGYKNYFFIDPKAERALAKDQIVVKTTKEIQGTKYIVFKGVESNNTYLGHDVKITFKYNDDIFTATEIKSNSYSFKLDAEDIDIERSLSKTESEGVNTVVYWKGDSRETFVLPDSFADKFVIYNNKLVDNFAYRQMLEAGENPVPETPEQNISFEDFLTESGSFRVIGESEYEVKRGNIDLIRIESYETYVAKSALVTSGDAKVLTDKYKKDGSGNPIKLELYEDGRREDYQLEMAYSNSANSSNLTLSRISANAVLDIARSLCGKYTKIIITQHDSKLSNLNIVEDRGSEIDLGSITNYKTYEASQYYMDNVYPTIQEEIEPDKAFTAYVNKEGKIVWAAISQAPLNIAYLKFAYSLEETGADDLEVNLLTSGNTIAKYTITDQTKFNGVRCRTLTDDEGRSGVEYVENALKEAAAVINAPKPGMSGNATFSQPIRYAANGTVLTHIETVLPDTENLVTSSTTPLYYSASDRVFHENTAEDIYTLSADSTIILMPNNRNAWSSNAHAIGKYSSTAITAKLKDNRKYLVEPYFTVNASGTRERKIFVIYYEDTSKNPDYFSNNAVVKSISPGQDNAVITTMAPYAGTYNVYNQSSNPKGYVLGSDFTRIKDENGRDIQREIKVGDVIRFSMTPDDRYMRTIEIVFDISEDIQERKTGVYDKYGEEQELAFGRDAKEKIVYFGRVGIVKSAPGESDADGKISLILQDGADYGDGKTSSTLDASMSTTVISYDHTLDDRNKFNTSSESIIKNLSDVHEGDMVMAVYNYTNKSTPQFVYVVRYEENMLGKYESQNQESGDE